MVEKKMLAFSVNSKTPDDGKGVLYPERTRNATGTVVGKSHGERYVCKSVNRRPRGLDPFAGVESR